MDQPEVHTGFCDFCSKYGTLHNGPYDNYLCETCLEEVLSDGGQDDESND
jgi:hypothetical protein